MIDYNYNTDNDGHEINDLGECIRFWSHPDDWGVQCIYLSTLNGIFEAFGMSVTVCPSSDGKG